MNYRGIGFTAIGFQSMQLMHTDFSPSSLETKIDAINLQNQQILDLIAQLINDERFI